jgi:predicted Holliday junction resolvase-like endonuclease
VTAKNKKAREIISALEKGRLRAVCPHCEEDFALAHAGLFPLDDFTDEAEELYKQRLEELKERKRELAEKRKKISETSQRGALAVNIGFILERLAPALKSFGFNRNDCRSLFDPIDYVIFEGLSKGQVNRLIFSDIKTGGARLTKKQRTIRDAVTAGKVEWDVYDRKGAR